MLARAGEIRPQDDVGRFSGADGTDDGFQQAHEFFGLRLELGIFFEPKSQVLLGLGGGLGEGFLPIAQGMCEPLVMGHASRF